MPDGVKKFVDFSKTADLSLGMATKLRLYRDKRRLTQAAVAHLAGMSERAYNVHENGKGGSCRPHKQAALADALGVAASVLFSKNGRAR